MTLTLDVEHANSTSTLKILAPDTLGDADAPSMRTLRIERKVIRQPEDADRAEAVVYRDAWDDVAPALDRRDDRFLIRDAGGSIIFGGRLVDVERSEITVSVIIESGKRDAIDAAPSGGNDAYPPQPDVDILQNELLPRVGTVAAGSLSQQDASIAFSESHASPGKSITKLARDAGAEVRYEPASGGGFEIDYVDRLGSDRSGETLSPSAAKVLGEPRVRQRTLEDVTHVSVLGANSGGAQIEATAVVSSFSSGDRAVHRRRVDKEIVDQSRAQKLADQLVAEYDGDPRYFEVECEIPTRVAPSLGDRFDLQLPEQGLGGILRITMLERILDEAGDRFRALLTNRRLTTDLQGDQKALELNSLSEGNAGQYYALVDGEGFDPVGPSTDYSFDFFRPQNTVGELRAKLRIQSRPYRLRASQVGHSHSVSVTHPDHKHGVAIATDSDVVSGDETTTDVSRSGSATLSSGLVVNAVTSFSLSNQGFPHIVRASLAKASGSSETITNVAARLVIDTDGDGIGESFKSVIADYGSDVENITSAENSTVLYQDLYQASSASFQIAADTASGNSVDVEWAVEVIRADPHRHNVVDSTESTFELGTTESTSTTNEAAVDPGVNEFLNEQVSNVSASIDGSQVASGLSAPVDETVDIKGILSDGANNITIQSDTLGEVRAKVELEGIKNADS